VPGQQRARALAKGRFLLRRYGRCTFDSKERKWYLAGRSRQALMGVNMQRLTSAEDHLRLVSLEPDGGRLVANLERTTRWDS
jgi:hypothetical protein